MNTNAVAEPPQTSGSKPIEVGSQRRLSPAHLKELAASGITPDTAREAGLYSEHDRKKIAGLTGWKSWPQNNGAVLVFPYRDLDGNTVLSRVKPERPPVRLGKPQKYIQPKGIPTRAYFPPGVADRLAANGVRVVITEGEKKALCASQQGFTTIGLSGVWNWKPGGKVSVLLPELEQIEWGGRSVYVAFDSDAAENSQVKAAEQQLAATLKANGASVKVVRIPGDAERGKQGLDDYIVANGSGAFEKLIEQAEEPEPVEPGLMKAGGSEMDPASEAASMLKHTSHDDGQCCLRFWRGEWWHWRKGSYQKVHVEDLRSEIVKRLNGEYEKLTKSHVSNVMQQLEALAIVSTDRDAPTWLDSIKHDPEPLECLASETGVVHIPSFVQSGQGLHELTPRFFTTSGLGYAFDPNAPPPDSWLEFLNSLWPNDPQSIRTLQQWFGYCLTPDTRHQKALMMVGPKRSGKGTIARVLTNLIGKANVASPTLSGLATNFGLWPLIGKSVALIGDARFSARQDQAIVVERLLSVTGEDSVTIDRKNLQPVTCKLNARFMILTNELPKLGDASGALTSRFVILHTPNSFYGKEDHGLFDALTAELPGILLWAIQGWHQLQAAGRFVVPDSASSLAQQIEDLSSPISAFVRDCCIVGPDHFVPTDELFKAWKVWCEDQNQHPGNNAKFFRDLVAAQPQLRKERPRIGSDRIYQYVGIDLGFDDFGPGGPGGPRE